MRWLARLFFPPQPPADALAERADVLAYLSRRQRNCAVMAANSHEFADAANDRARQLAVISDEIGAGFHQGAARVEELIEGKGRDHGQAQS